MTAPQRAAPDARVGRTRRLRLAATLGEGCVMKLTGGVSYDLDEAYEVVVGYCCGREPNEPSSARRPPEGLEVRGLTDRPAFGYAFYDAAPKVDVPAGLATVLDVLVASGLNARMTGRHLARLVGALDAINHHLARIEPDADFLQVPSEGLSDPTAGDETTRQMWAAWWAAAQVDGINVARVNKLLHRVRPALFPLYDQQTRPLLGPQPWDAIRRDLDTQQVAFADLLGRLEATPFRGMPRPGPLRIHDILLWCEVAERRSVAKRLGESYLEEAEHPPARLG